MARREVLFSESAITDLESVREFYREQPVPHVGDRLVAEIVGSIEQLADLPDSGRIVPEFERPWLRELIHSPFRIVFRLDDDAIRIVRVWRSERPMDGEPGRDA
jgi:plasmid stabilization system protein ParE